MEQFNRTKRYLERLNTIYSGVFSSDGHDKYKYDDDVVSFFIHCYHVRDWIIHLNKLGITAKQVDNYINQHLALKVCADLANGSKHCNLTRNLRTSEQPHIAYKEHQTSTWLTGNGVGEVMESKYSIVADTETYDALELATECVNLWSEYIEQLKTHNKALKRDSAKNAALI
ncbi:MAG: hypothetical protein KAT90_14690 [Gammaproteobacteria bacterium]|nr:hypothetical protein [Gammaproteobacteria bacterium]